MQFLLRITIYNQHHIFPDRKIKGTVDGVIPLTDQQKEKPFPETAELEEIKRGTIVKEGNELIKIIKNAPAVAGKVKEHTGGKKRRKKTRKKKNKRRKRKRTRRL
jgi:hypothetical protein